MPSGRSDDNIPTVPHADGDVVAPDHIARFVVQHTIGAGGMGVVVAAYDPVLDRRVALKLLRGGDVAGDARLILEAQAMARLAHPNVVAVHEAGVADGRVYLAMELVDGGTLRAWLETPRDWRAIRDRFVEAGRGLAAAHDAGLVHRDFKPDNVLVGRDGRARVTDFGLVRTASPGDDAPPADPRATALAGTPRYMAPEQHLGQPADARADQFAFCVALYEALWRRDPFGGDGAGDDARRARVLRGEVVDGNASPAWLAAIVARGLASDPAARFPSMQALLDQLVRDPDARRRRLIRAIAGASAAAVALAIGAAVIGRAVMSDLAPSGPRLPSDAPDPLRLQRGLVATWTTGDDAGELAALAATGATSATLVIDWAAIEQPQGSLAWDATDARISALEQRGLEPFATIGASPTWLARDAEVPCATPPRNPPANTRETMRAFREFYRALSHRYCGRVKYYEFWPEPNDCAWMRCGCADPPSERAGMYGLWLDQWYQAMREGCVDVTLAVGGLACRDASCAAFVDQLYDNGAGDSFDAVAIHVDLGAGDGALREVRAALARHGNPTRPLWLTAWTVRDSDKLGDALAKLRELPDVFAAHFAGRDAWPAFHDRVLGAATRWHGPLNPGLEFQGQPPSLQFANPMPGWGPNGAWQYHRLVPRTGSDVLGRKFGYYSAGLLEHFGQTLGDRYERGRRYCFACTATGGRRKSGALPLQLGYRTSASASDRDDFVALATRVVNVDASWRDTPAVCHDVVDNPALPFGSAASAGSAGRVDNPALPFGSAALAGSAGRVDNPALPFGSEVGQPITVRFGAGADGGANDIWFDNLRVTSTPIAP